ncbi:hypothetical protein CDQ91_06540 [Sphingopyxis witflariensis]|uniref:Uncharacterized protein n=2 Tax=Sphingopyxis witflariensis TaxID=173675 RepID=A0A246K617_9SPHN|nr:hypothetical protein CDQ91_06540 [Sphingopyxis witflariensis]
MLILGGITALYFIWLLFRAAALTLPLYAGAGAALLLHDQGYGLAAVLAAGFMIGLVVQLTGQLFYTSIRSPLLRALVALLFAGPAGFAGYQVVTGLAGLAIDKGVWLDGLALAGGLCTASSAWRGLGRAGSDEQGESVPLTRTARVSIPASRA